MKMMMMNIFIQNQDSTVTRLKAWKSGLEILAGKERYLLFSDMSRAALVLTQPSTEWVP
jgi:hypothetical protein